MADVYREKVGSLCLALESEESRTSAVDAIRALIETILLEPDGDELKIRLKGDLAGMLSAARDSKRSPENQRPPTPNKAGCGGSQPTLSAALAACGLTSESYTSKRARIDHSDISPL
jgi:hypothetical protein